LFDMVEQFLLLVPPIDAAAFFVGQATVAGQVPTQARIWRRRYPTRFLAGEQPNGPHSRLASG
jgi:hypothetical protein